MIDIAVPDSAEESMTEIEVQSAEMGMTEAYCYTAGVYMIDTFGSIFENMPAVS